MPGNQKKIIFRTSFVLFSVRRKTAVFQVCDTLTIVFRYVYIIRKKQCDACSKVKNRYAAWVY
jgi:hypothetical protein